MADRFKFGYGDLNPVESPFIGKSLDFDSTSILDALRRAALNVYKKDSLVNTGPMRGIVLRVDDAATPSNSWITNIFGEEKPPVLKQVKVRIPELHAMLPEPAKYGKNAGPSNKVIDMYPSFIAATVDVSNKPVNAGDIVLVDFENRNNLTGPIYLGPVMPGPQGTPGQETTKELTDKRDNKLCCNAPTGDVIGQGKSKNRQAQAPTMANCVFEERVVNRSEADVEELSHASDKDSNVTDAEARFEMAYSRGKELGRIEVVPVPREFIDKGAQDQNMLVAKDQLNNLTALIQAARDAGVELKLNSAFRTNEQQKEKFDREQRARRQNPNRKRKPVAAPKKSNHQTGIAFDFARTKKSNGTPSKTYRWLAENASKFGFYNTGREFRRDTPKFKIGEQWHWEFLGLNHPKIVAFEKLSYRKKEAPFFGDYHGYTPEEVEVKV